MYGYVAAVDAAAVFYADYRGLLLWGTGTDNVVILPCQHLAKLIGKFLQIGVDAIQIGSIQQFQALLEPVKQRRCPRAALICQSVGLPRLLAVLEIPRRFHAD